MIYADTVLDVPPPRLFKYRAFDTGHESGQRYARDRELINRSALWKSSPSAFNDPFDCVPVIDQSGTSAERTEFAKRLAERRRTRQERKRYEAEIRRALKHGFNLSDDVSLKLWTDMLPELGVVSLAEHPDNMLMWGYYADSHRGYCLEYDTTSEPLNLAHRVSYDKHRPMFRILDPDRNNLFERILLYKADFWSHEREWRIVRRYTGHLSIPRNALKSIVLGASISAEDEQAIRDLVADRTPTVSLKRTVLNLDNFRLSIISA